MQDDCSALKPREKTLIVNCFEGQRSGEVRVSLLWEGRSRALSETDSNGRCGKINSAVAVHCSEGAEQRRRAK